MLNEIEKAVVKPEVFAKSKEAFWDDDYMSEQFLKAHLNPDWDAASRKHSIINKSVEWIQSFSKGNSKILDLGCGPGLYANQLAELGNEVVGIDFSKRSINYAKRIAKQKKLKTKFVYKNYLEIDYEEEFDYILLIYCDLGALINKERDILLKKIYRALKPNGRFIFDVHSFNYSLDLINTFSYHKEEQGFFTKKKHLELKQIFYYEKNQTYLDQYTIVTDQKITQQRVYKQLYDRAKLKSILLDYQDIMFLADITGVEFNKDSDTIAVVARK